MYMYIIKYPNVLMKSKFFLYEIIHLFVIFSNMREREREKLMLESSWENFSKGIS